MVDSWPEKPASPSFSSISGKKGANSAPADTKQKNVPVSTLAQAQSVEAAIRTGLLSNPLHP